MENRLVGLRKKLLEEKLDALLLIDSESSGWENLFYYSGFHGSSAVVAVTQERAVLATDSRYLTQAAQQSPFEIRAVKTGESQVATAGRLLDELKIRRCGYDGAMLCAQTYLALSEFSVEWRNFSSAMAEQRRRKDAREIELIARAADIASAAYLETLPLVRPGMREKEFAKLLELNIARHDGEGVWHKSDMIVASGVRSAMPHGVAS